MKLLYKELTGTTNTGCAAWAPNHAGSTMSSESIGSLKFNHFVVKGTVMHFPVAIRDVTDVNANNLKDWMRYQVIRLGILTNFYDTATHPVFIRT